MKYTDPEGYCIICGFKGIDLHHIKTRGAGGTDDNYNLMPLCHPHHQQCHTVGLNKFSQYSRVRRWLLENGWEFDHYINKWVRY